MTSVLVRGSWPILANRCDELIPRMRENKRWRMEKDEEEEVAAAEEEERILTNNPAAIAYDGRAVAARSPFPSQRSVSIRSCTSCSVRDESGTRNKICIPFSSRSYARKSVMTGARLVTVGKLILKFMQTEPRVCNSLTNNCRCR
ncbi:hypothetical protein P5V15_008539 [Pogonomyrmex californicus]